MLPKPAAVFGADFCRAIGDAVLGGRFMFFLPSAGFAAFFASLFAFCSAVIVLPLRGLACFCIGVEDPGVTATFRF